jgi:L-ascorbate 6-phosphate lactonase
MLKFSTGQILCIDPYLNDCAERMAGYPRLSLAPLTAEEVSTDVYLITHDHPDHLDVDGFDTIVAKNPGCTVIAGKSCEPFLKTRSVPYKLAAIGEHIQCGNIKITAVSADHGDLCPGAIGFIIQFKNRMIYFTDDTSLNENLLAPAISIKSLSE